MTQPAANLSAALKKDRNPKGGVAETFRAGEKRAPTKKATYELPQDLHRALHLHAVAGGVSMRDLVVKYIEEGLANEGVDLRK